MQNNVTRKHSMWSQMVLVCIVLVAVVSFVTHFYGYARPDGLFWDENYHIPSAQKYLNGVFFIEYHPPLGKLLIALGEYLIAPNAHLDLSSLHSTSYIKDIPEGFSFLGVRLFPALFGWLSVIMFYLLMFEVSQRSSVSAAFTTFFMFDNALVVHFRGAMLDSFLMFFLLAGLWWGFRMMRCKNLRCRDWLVFGVLAGLAVSVKVTGGIILVIAPIVFYVTHMDAKFRVNSKLLLLLAKTSSTTVLGLLIPIVAVFYIHFCMGTHFAGNQFYKASPELRMAIEAGRAGELSVFPLMLRDSYRFFRYENQGVPVLDVCKPEENGSYPTSWIVGSKTINYRWTKNNDGSIQYLYLVMNPVVVLISLFALLTSIILVGGRVCYRLPIQNSRLFFIVVALLVMYISYMAAMLHIDRVMYLYHYFPPYVFLLVASCALFCYSFETYLAKWDWIVLLALGLVVVDVVAVFLFFSPLTYFEPLTQQEFVRRIWFTVWQLEPVL